MHLVDGLVSAPVLGGASVLAVAGVAIGLKTVDADRLPQAALASSVFFVASLIHIPLGPSSVHLLMSGLAGVMLGWTAFPALLVALALQAMFFGFGGLTTLGVNTLIMAAPAVLAGWAGRHVMKRGTPRATALGGAVAGAGAILLGAALTAALLAASGDAFTAVAQALVVAHLPVAAIEGAVTAAAMTFLARLKPEALPANA